MLLEAVKGRKNSSPERFEKTLHCQIFHSKGTKTLICVFPFYFRPWKYLARVCGPQYAMITTVFLTLWLAGHWGCIWEWKSLNNSMRTGGIFASICLKYAKFPPDCIFVADWKNQRSTQAAFRNWRCLRTICIYSVQICTTSEAQ